MRELPCALTPAIMMRTAHATTGAQYTATGIDLRRALGWTYRCRPPLADAPMRSKRVTKDSTFRSALLHGAFCHADSSRRSFSEERNHGEGGCRHHRGNRINVSPAFARLRRGRQGVATKFILIWLCLSAPLSLNERMKTSAITNTPRAVSVVVSLLCAGLLALSLSGCADTYYAAAPDPGSRYNTYHAPYYYPYSPWYAYYGGAYYYGVIR